MEKTISNHVGGTAVMCSTADIDQRTEHPGIRGPGWTGKDLPVVFSLNVAHRIDPGFQKMVFASELRFVD